MAFVEDEKKKTPEEEALDVKTGGESSLIAGQGSVQGSQGQAAAAPGNFTGIQKYIDANKSQTGELASKLGDTVSTGVQTAKDTINTEADKFAGDVRSATTQDPTKQPGFDAVGIANDPTKSQNWKDTVAGVYKGPEQFVASTEANKKINEANTLGQLASSPEGVTQLTNKAFAPEKKTTVGGSMLNAALLGSDPNARQVLGAAAGKIPTIAETLNLAGQKTASDVQQAKQANTSLGQQIKNKPIEVATTIANAPHTNTVNEIVAGATTRADGIKNKIINEFNKGKGKANFNLSPEELESLGVTPEQWAPITQRLSTLRDNFSDFEGWDIASWFDQADPTAGITSGNSMSDDEYAKVVSLYKLAGQEPPAREARPKVSAMKFNPAKFEAWIKDYTNRNVNKRAPEAPAAPAPNAQGGFQQSAPTSIPNYQQPGTLAIDPTPQNFTPVKVTPQPPKPSGMSGYQSPGTLAIEWW